MFFGNWKWILSANWEFPDISSGSKFFILQSTIWSRSLGQVAAAWNEEPQTGARGRSLERGVEAWRKESKLGQNILFFGELFLSMDYTPEILCMEKQFSIFPKSHAADNGAHWTWFNRRVDAVLVCSGQDDEGAPVTSPQQGPSSDAVKTRGGE